MGRGLEPAGPQRSPTPSPQGVGNPAARGGGQGGDSGPVARVPEGWPGRAHAMPWDMLRPHLPQDKTPRSNSDLIPSTCDFPHLV